MCTNEGVRIPPHRTFLYMSSPSWDFVNHLSWGLWTIGRRFYLKARAFTSSLGFLLAVSSGLDTSPIQTKSNQTITCYPLPRLFWLGKPSLAMAATGKGVLSCCWPLGTQTHLLTLRDCKHKRQSRLGNPARRPPYQSTQQTTHSIRETANLSGPSRIPPNAEVVMDCPPGGVWMAHGGE
ncbi:hypothetical protein BDZ91DRAFT_414529 [Kalaharituber pfeilii]|nr:hypothetical protein BDZ91DRAFT_414529 [Kalaharituber pfeilii]